MAKAPTNVVYTPGVALKAEVEASVNTVAVVANASYRPTGAYNNTRTYNVNETATDGGSEYKAIQDGFAGRPVTDTTYWSLLSSSTPIGGATPSNGQVPTYNATNGRYEAATPVFPNLADAKGDLFVATADNTVTRLPVGADGTRLIADSSQPTGVRWATAPVRIVLASVTVTASATIAATTDIQQVNTSSGNTQTLPASITNQLGYVCVKCIYFAGTPGVITIVPNSGQTIENGISPQITSAGTALTFYLDGTVWRLGI